MGNSQASASDKSSSPSSRRASNDPAYPGGRRFTNPASQQQQQMQRGGGGAAVMDASSVSSSMSHSSALTTLIGANSSASAGAGGSASSTVSNMSASSTIAPHFQQPQHQQRRPLTQQSSNVSTTSTGSNSSGTGGSSLGGSGAVSAALAAFEASSSPPPFGSPLDTPSFMDGFNYGNAFPDPVPVAMVLDDDYPSLGVASKRSSTKKDTIPTVFRWNRGGKNVYVTGTFNGWKGRLPLNKSHDEFSTIVELPPGNHQYKFIVDDEWMYSPDQPTVPDPYGAMNNFVDVLPVDVAYDIEADAASVFSTSPPGTYGQDIPPLEYGAKPPPVLPPHLLQVILNSDPVSEDDPTLLPVPNHVMLNHLYALSIKDGVMVLGVTHRFKKKYITTVLYRSV